MANPNLQELLSALERADAANDEPAAREIAKAIQLLSQQGSQQAAPQTEDQGTLRAVGQGVAQGATFGFADEMGAGIRAALGGFAKDSLDTFGERYKENVTENRADLASAREHHPWATGISEFLPGLAYGGAGVARGLGSAAVRAGAREVGKRSLRSAAPRLAGIGAGYGGVAGAGYSESGVLDDTGGFLGDVAMGAGLGAGIGTALPAATAGIKRGAQNIGRRFGASGAGVEGAAREAARREIIRDLKRDGLTLREAEMILDANPNLMLGDLGENLGQQGANVMNQPGAGGAKLKSALQTRQEGTFDRVVPELRRGAEESLLTSKGMAVPGNYAEAERAIIERARVITEPLWDVAYSPNFRPTSWIRRQMARTPNADGTPGRITNPRWRRADNEAREAIQLRIARGVEDGGIAADHPGLVAMHYDEMQRSLRDRISQGKRGRGGVDIGDRKGTLLEGEHRRFIKEMKTAMPEEWSAARKIWAGEAANKEAFEAGQKVFTSYADDITIRLNEMTMSERDSYIVGALRAIENKLARQADTGDILRSLRSTRAGKDIVRIVFGDEDGFRKFMNFADDEMKMLNFYKRSQGSPTFGRQAKGADTGGAIGTLAGMWVGMNFGFAGAPLLGRFAGRKAVNTLARADEMKRDSVAQMLRTRSPQALNQQMQRPNITVDPISASLGLGSAAALPGMLE